MIKALKEFKCLKCECYYCNEKGLCTRNEWCELWKCKTNNKSCFKSWHLRISLKDSIKKIWKGIKEYEEQRKNR